MNKDELVRTIKEWIQADNEIRDLAARSAARKDDKKRLSAKLVDVMHENNVDCFSVANEKIVYNRTNVKKPVTKKSLIAILAQYYENDTEKVEELSKFIMDNREVSVKETITRKAAPHD